MTLLWHKYQQHQCKDEIELETMVWLEDQKIRYQQIRLKTERLHETFTAVTRLSSSKDISQTGTVFLQIQDLQVTVDWLLGLAMRLDYADNAENYKDLGPDTAKHHVDSATKTAEHWISLDVNNPAWKIHCHGDYLIVIKVQVMVKALLTVVQELLTQEDVAGPNQTKGGLPDASDECILGFDTGNAVLCEATQVLLQIEELGELQTKMKAARVAVQAILADPKTDHETRGLWGMPGSTGHIFEKNHS
uniref:RNA transcription, translation and transport factor protein n=1 Tax=Moschus moschiferus TaxID=68415 RepID=A0A8C6DEM0_MOSMO